jgi:hypothetical protein
MQGIFLSMMYLVAPQAEHCCNVGLNTPAALLIS